MADQATNESRLLNRIAELQHTIEVLTQGKPKPEPVSTADTIAALIIAKTRANRRPVYLKSLRYFLTKFAGLHPRLDIVTIADIESWLNRFDGNYYRQTWLNRLSTLFSFAVRRGLIAANPCERIDRVIIDRVPVTILTVEQSRQLLATCPPKLKPYLVLGMFAGVRPEEILRMKWSDVRFDTCTIRVIGKTRRNRLVPLEPIVVDYLRDYPQDSERVAPSRSTVRRWLRKTGRNILGGNWHADVLRHTAASYLLARHQDPNKVAFWLGNSPQILMTHYHEPVTAETSERFWNLNHVNANN